MRTSEDYIRAEGEAGLCKRCKLTIRMECSEICSKCHAYLMNWIFHDRENKIREFRNMGKGG